jgi:hypothetical protein
MRRASSSSARKIVGLGFLPDEARHGFLVTVPKGSGGEMICITEHRGNDLNSLASAAPKHLPPAIPRLRVASTAPAGWRWPQPSGRRPTAACVPMAFPLPSSPRTQASPSLCIHLSGKELCILCWAVEDAPPDDIPNALRNWEALAPEERWWLYTMTVATTGQAMQKGLGWRKAFRAAIADNPFVKGEGLSPKARRELLGHSQLSLSL